MLKIPGPLLPGFKILAAMSSDQLRTVSEISSIAIDPGKLSQLAESLSTNLDLDSEEGARVAQAIISTIGLRSQFDHADEFFDALTETLNESFTWQVAESEILDFLRSIVNDKGEIGITFKGWTLSRDTSQLFSDAQTVIDARPVFDSTDDDPSSIKAYIIMSTLRIDYFDRSKDEGSELTVRLSVDEADLEKLEIVIARARKKISVLKDELSENGKRIIDV